MKPYLNIGCGGHFTPDWTNVDLITHPGVIYADITRGLPVPDNSFEMVYASHVLEHLTESQAQALLEECLRVLKPGGVCRMVVPDLEDICREYLNCLDDCLKSETPENEEHYRWITIELLDQMVRENSGGKMREFLDGPIMDREYIRKRAGDMAPGLKHPKSGDSPKLKMKTPGASLKRWWRKRRLRWINRWLGPRHTGEIHRWMYDRYSLKGLMQKVGFISLEALSSKTSKHPQWNHIGLDSSEHHDGPRKPVSLYMEGVKPDA